MTLHPVGQVLNISRYPVKSFAGESIHRTRVESYGLYGDRCHCFIDDTKEGWDRFITARQLPRMLGYKAELVEGACSSPAPPEVSITSPDGRSFSWNDELLHELKQHWSRPIAMQSYSGGLQGTDLLAVDTASILLITDVTLRRLEALWGKPVDPRRFRANLMVSLQSITEDERAWIGKRLSIGDVQLSVDLPCERCTMITLDPDTLKRDATLLRKVNEEMDLCFGVYASVVKTGEIRVGDPVYVDSYKQ